MQHHVAWLAGVLAARDFPLEHLAANLELAADVVEDRIEQGPAVADRLRAAAITVRECQYNTTRPRPGTGQSAGRARTGA